MFHHIFNFKITNNNNGYFSCQGNFLLHIYEGSNEYLRKGVSLKHRTSIAFILNAIQHKSLRKKEEDGITL